MFSSIKNVICILGAIALIAVSFLILLTGTVLLFISVKLWQANSVHHYPLLELIWGFIHTSVFMISGFLVFFIPGINYIFPGLKEKLITPKTEAVLQYKRIVIFFCLILLIAFVEVLCIAPGYQL